MKWLFDVYDEEDIVGHVPLVHLEEFLSPDATPALTDDDDDAFGWRRGERGETIRFCAFAEMLKQSRVALGPGHGVSRAKHLRYVALSLRPYAEWDASTWANGTLESVLPSAEGLLGVLPPGSEEYSSYRERFGENDGDTGIYVDARVVSRVAGLDVARELKESESLVDRRMGTGLEDRLWVHPDAVSVVLGYVGATLVGFGSRFLDCTTRLKGRSFAMAHEKDPNVITGQFILVDTATIARNAKDAGVSAHIACDISEGVIMTILNARYPNGQPNQAPGGGMVRGQPWLRIYAIRRTAAFEVMVQTPGTTMQMALLTVDEKPAADVAAGDVVAGGWIDTIMDDAAVSNSFVGVLADEGPHGTNAMERRRGHTRPTDKRDITFGELSQWLRISFKSLRRRINITRTDLTSFRALLRVMPSPCALAAFVATRCDRLRNRTVLLMEDLRRYESLGKAGYRAAAAAASLRHLRANPSVARCPAMLAIIDKRLETLAKAGDRSGANSPGAKAKAKRVAAAAPGAPLS